MQHNFVFWIGDKEFKHIYGVRPNSAFKFDTPSNVDCHSYFLELFCLYGRKYTVKYIGVDKVNINDINVCLIPAQSLPNIASREQGEITTATLLAKDIINWCYDNEVKVIIDRSREKCSWNINERLKYLKECNLIDYNYFRVLVNHSVKDDTSLYQNLIIDSEFFLWEMGGLAHNYINSPKIKKLNITDNSNLEKRYTFSALMGEVRKPHRLNLKTHLYKSELLDKAFWSTVNRYSDLHVDKCYAKEHQEYIVKYGKSLFDIIIKEHRFDNTNQKLNNATDRIIPTEFYQCNFNIPFESSMKDYFYTEKTYKPIATNQPFLIFGQVGINSFITTKGFEIFDEVFDYKSIECEGIKSQKYIKRFADEVVRVVNEPDCIWTQKSVINKCKHNSSSLKQRTTKEKFNDFIIKVFDAW
jgi:hypothetical protein